MNSRVGVVAVVVVVLSGAFDIVTADSVDLMARYVITTRAVNRLTGATTSESREFKLIRAKLKVSKHVEDGETFLVFTCPAGEGKDTSEESVGLVKFVEQANVLSAIKDAAAKTAKAGNAVKATESSEVVWKPDDKLSLTLYTQTKMPRAFAEFQVDQCIYVLRTATEFEKLAALAAGMMLRLLRRDEHPVFFVAVFFLPLSLNDALLPSVSSLAGARRAAMTCRLAIEPIRRGDERTTTA